MSADTVDAVPEDTEMVDVAPEVKKEEPEDFVREKKLGSGKLIAQSLPSPGNVNCRASRLSKTLIASRDSVHASKGVESLTARCTFGLHIIFRQRRMNRSSVLIHRHVFYKSVCVQADDLSTSH